MLSVIERRLIPSLFEIAGELDQVLHRPAEPIEFPNPRAGRNRGPTSPQGDPVHYR